MFSNMEQAQSILTPNSVWPEIMLDDKNLPEEIELGTSASGKSWIKHQLQWDWKKSNWNGLDTLLEWMRRENQDIWEVKVEERRPRGRPRNTWQERIEGMAHVRGKTLREFKAIASEINRWKEFLKASPTLWWQQGVAKEEEEEEELKKVYGDTVMNERNVRKWCKMFNNVRINVHDETDPDTHHSSQWTPGLMYWRQRSIRREF